MSHKRNGLRVGVILSGTILDKLVNAMPEMRQSAAMGEIGQPAQRNSEVFCLFRCY